jgi:Tol biopolymer transport system component
VLQLVPPAGSEFGSFAVSPDGGSLAFTANDPKGVSQLWVRRLDSIESRSLPETEGATDPFWSPDGNFIAFFAGNKLKKIGVSGGSPQTLCTLLMARGGTRGGSWGRGGVILFAIWPFGPAPLYQVSESGGDPQPVTPVENFAAPAQRWWPSLLPDGRHFLYLAVNNVEADRTGVYLASLDALEARLVLRTETSAVY